MSTTQSPAPFPFDLDRPIVYFNQWRDFENHEIRDAFRNMTPEEVRAIQVGDIVWRDVDPLHRHGKVYGNVPMRVKRIEQLDGGQIKFHFRRGMRVVDVNRSTHPLMVVNDLPALVELVREHPLSKKV